MKDSRAVKRQRQHEQNCIWAVFDWAVFGWYFFGMRRAATADESREVSTTGNLIARSPRHEQLRNLSELPKKCIKAILSFTTPRDVCRLAAVCRLFRSAANSNSLWKKFIPPQCYQILPTAVTFSPSSSKKVLYFRLCDSILIDRGTKRFWLERSTGKIGYMLSAKAIWMSSEPDRRYWRWIYRNDSRFDNLVKLQDVCWLEIKGGLDCRLLSSDTEYRVVFRLKFTEDSHGWTGQSVNFEVTTPDGEEIKSEQLWGQRECANHGWIEVVAGEFTVRAAKDLEDDSSSVSFRMSDLTSWWKGGLLIDGVKIEPCSSTDDESREESNAQPRWHTHEPEQDKEQNLRNLPKLPKECIKAILSFTTPRDVCRSAAVSTLFRSAANSDSVWSKFIPPQCYQIHPSAVTLDLFPSKRELYFCLCDSILIKGERKENQRRFWLERSTAKIGYMLSARELSIANWGHDQRCWRWIYGRASRFGELAELLSVYRLDVGGGMDCRLLSPDTRYRVVFVLKFGERAHGWNERPIKFSVQTAGEKEMEFRSLFQVKRRHLISDGWMEVVAGEFTVRAAENIDDDSCHIRFRMKELESNCWKGGLLIDGVRIEPLKLTEDSHGRTGQAGNVVVTMPEGEGINSEQRLGVREGVANDDWKEVVADKSTVRTVQDDSSSISFRMTEPRSSWKGGLPRDGVKIEPYSSREGSTVGNLNARLSPHQNMRNLPDLPVECIKAIISFTTPRDVCRLAAVSRLFRSAANSDSVWSKFIPPQFYKIQPSAVAFDLFPSKKELYFCLCGSILLKENQRRFWLERSTAKIGYMLSARELSICWGNNQHYWRWISRDDSRFEELAELLRVCWFDVNGGIDCRLLSPDTRYRVVFVLKFGERAHGWNARPIKISVQTPGESEMEFEHVFLVGQGSLNNGGWMEVVAGEFTVKAAENIDDDSCHIRFRMKEVESNLWKGGLLIDGVKIEPLKFTEDSNGWAGQAVNSVVTTPEGEGINSEQLLGEREGMANDESKKVVADEFRVRAAQDVHDHSSSMSFRMTETRSSWKGGRLIDGVKIEPWSNILHERVPLMHRLVQFPSMDPREPRMQRWMQLMPQTILQFPYVGIDYRGDPKMISPISKVRGLQDVGPWGREALAMRGAARAPTTGKVWRVETDLEGVGTWRRQGRHDAEAGSSARPLELAQREIEQLQKQLVDVRRRLDTMLHGVCEEGWVLLGEHIAEASMAPDREWQPLLRRAAVAGAAARAMMDLDGGVPPQGGLS